MGVMGGGGGESALPSVSRGWWAVAGPCPWSECAFAWGLGGLCGSDAAPASCTEDFWFSLLTLDIPALLSLPWFSEGHTERAELSLLLLYPHPAPSR